ncbi:MAG: hypothetical protein LBJ00_15335 [Planctomycetaceae bacterium]|nr:hypothetical protein [Planctomycetaceae bacterium]
MNNRFTLLRFRNQLCGISKQLEYNSCYALGNFQKPTVTEASRLRFRKRGRYRSLPYEIM